MEFSFINNRRWKHEAPWSCRSYGWKTGSDLLTRSYCCCYYYKPKKKPNSEPLQSPLRWGDGRRERWTASQQQRATIIFITIIHLISCRIGMEINWHTTRSLETLLAGLSPVHLIPAFICIFIYIVKLQQQQRYVYQIKRKKTKK